MLSDRRSKIVATIGPASNSPETLKNLIETGVNIFRLNFSHGTHEDHFKVLKTIRQLSQELNAAVGILQDIQGPKIRVNKLKNKSMTLKKGEKVTITEKDVVGGDGVIPVDYKKVSQSCKPGMRILLDDGLIELRVEEVKKQEVICLVIFGGELKERKGVNLPGAELEIECMTEKDLVDLEFGIKNEVDYIALSFIRHERDVVKLRSILEKAQSKAKIVAKIEMLEALGRLEAIIKESDAVMVARGDLAIEVGQTLLPGTQKEIIKLSNYYAKPVITATQMLDSMVHNPRPTRAEITDIANAVLDGSDALMLSAETASGEYPVLCVQTMVDIILEVEKTSQNYYKLDLKAEFLSVAEAIAASACLSALKLDAKAIVCLTTSGKTATMIASYRPKAKIFAATYLMPTLNKMELVWGIQNLQVKEFNTSDEIISQVTTLLLKFELVQAGDRVIFTMGLPVKNKGTTDSLRVYTVPEMNIPKTNEIEIPLRFHK